MQPLRHLSPDELDELGQQMQRLMDKGWISHSRSLWGTPVLFAPKKDGGLRCCIDCRALNKMTHKDATPLPNLSELRDRLVNMRVFTAIDIRNAYHCIMIRLEDREKTAFRTRFGHFEYNVLPISLTNAPATFERLTNKLLGDKSDAYVISYLDDILIFSTDMNSHIEHVDEVLKTLAEHRLHVKPSKCQWAVDEVEFCGHRVGKDGLSIAPFKVTAVRERPRPTNSLELLSFMGLINYIKEYIPEYAQIALPLTNLQSGNRPWQWDNEEDKAFNRLKELCSSAPTLAYFDPMLDTYLFTDASGYAYGGWLAQPAKGDFPYPHPLPTTKLGLANLPQLRPVTYYSRKMQPAETQYPVHEQELLGLVKSIRANRQYLIGCPFRAFVDHKSLIYLQEQPRLSRRQAGWVEFLQQFDFSVEYLPGTWNSIADFLSRDPTYAPKCATCQAKIDVVTAIVQPETTATTHMPTDADWTRALASNDFGQNILLTLEGPQENLSGHARRFRTVDSPPDRFLMYHDSLRAPLLQIHHDSLANGGHSGVQRTLAKLLELYYWPHMERDVYQYVRTCPTCQRHKRAVPIGFLRSLPIPDARWQQIGMDIFFPTSGSKGGEPRVEPDVTKNPSKDTGDRLTKTADAVLLIVDYLSCRVILLPTNTRATAQKTAQLFLEQAFRHTGLPHTIVSDRDPKWLSEFWQYLMRALDIKQELSLLPTLEYNYNRTPQTSTGLSPFEIDLGRVPRIPNQWVAPNPGEMIKQSAQTAVERRNKEFADVNRIVQQQLRDAQDQQARYYDRKKHTEAYRDGDKVLLNREGIMITSVTTRNKKLAEQWTGPFTVRGKGPHPDTYELGLPKEFTGLHPVFHVSILRRYYDLGGTPY
ncbi:hypothetical protein PhCBS80983_g06010 [Powellomyces hirtus]|uniref:Reverse transcriptase domain-containing protein n=1 Tax=Powellomyces hirtus TaxID=109895 RepID=A0A507DR82_9FUNG|nr:hypothetical protein PhCBS80983_g06010 [Powellomyces hirtus]